MADIDNTKDLTKFKALSFDCYGTLIEWEPGLIQALQPVISKLPPDHPYAKDPQLALLRFDHFSNALENDQPTLRYDLNLTTALQQLAADAGLPDGSLAQAELDGMAHGPGRWPAFADTIEGLATLKRHYKLIILSNIDNANIAATTAGPLAAVPFDAVYTAEDIGSYKPARQNFEYLFRRARDELGVDVEKGELLHVARSLRVDHSAAKALGFSSCWISRGGEKKDGQGIGGDYEAMVKEGKVSFQWRFDTIGAFAREVAKQFGDE
ncbi:haloacid dehalogenase [Diaporthe amygdali]|uniref:haloacid dehalogenase n=1 Tax=Phomopsis amygdali TaxID=1214568 RepID=UPI0022FEFAA1|nr:haloacid dehalogenase [Diaporthe amygdali]KAJ0122242.1 haloacid dehalogenase [Diaporthe amygdali]